MASLFFCGAWAAGNPKIAVTDLSYENKVSGYFEKLEIKGKRTRTASANERYNDSEYSSSENSSARERSREEVSVRASTEFETHIDRGELRKFTADIKNLDMPPMTMVFQVKDPAMLEKVKAGDKVQFTVDNLNGALTVLTIEPAKM